MQGYYCSLNLFCVWVCLHSKLCSIMVWCVTHLTPQYRTHPYFKGHIVSLDVTAARLDLLDCSNVSSKVDQEVTMVIIVDLFYFIFCPSEVPTLQKHFATLKHISSKIQCCQVSVMLEALMKTQTIVTAADNSSCRSRQ